MNLVVLDDADAVADEARRRVRAAAADAVAARGRFALAVSGGSTPRRLFERLEAGDLDWVATTIALVDERHVAPDDDDANARLVRTSLLDHVTAAAFLAPPFTGDLAADAAAYGRTLEAAFGAPPVFDLVLLGMGDDGHTASLFPGDEGALTAAGTTTAGHAPVPPHDRISLCLEVLDAARAVVVLVAGAAKAEALARVRAGDPLPAGRVAGATFLVDRAAATPPAQ